MQLQGACSHFMRTSFHFPCSTPYPFLQKVVTFCSDRAVHCLDIARPSYYKSADATDIGAMRFLVKGRRQRRVGHERDSVVPEIFGMNITMGPLDWTIIGIYLCGVVGLGVGAGFLRRKGERGGEGGHYFLAGSTLAR